MGKGVLTPPEILQSCRFRSNTGMYLLPHGRIQRGADGPDPTLEKSQNIGFVSNIGPDPLKNHKATKPAFTVVYHRPASKVPFEWYRISLVG